MAELFDRSRLIELLRRDALRTGTFTLASGRSSHYYVDGRKVTLSAEGAALIGLGVLTQLADLPAVSAVGGLTMGADPIVCARLGSVAATYALEHLGGQSHAYTWAEFHERYESQFGVMALA